MDAAREVQHVAVGLALKYALGGLFLALLLVANMNATRLLEWWGVWLGAVSMLGAAWWLGMSSGRSDTRAGSGRAVFSGVGEAFVALLIGTLVGAVPTFVLDASLANITMPVFAAVLGVCCGFHTRMRVLPKCRR